MTGETLGSRIKEERKHLGLSQGELGDMAGINRDTLSRIERDVQLPDAAEIAILAGLFGRSVDWLLGRGIGQENDAGLVAAEQEPLRYGVELDNLEAIEVALIGMEGAVAALEREGKPQNTADKARIFQTIYRGYTAQASGGIAWTTDTTPFTERPTTPPSKRFGTGSGGAKS